MSLAVLTVIKAGCSSSPPEIWQQLSEPRDREGIFVFLHLPSQHFGEAILSLLTAGTEVGPKITTSRIIEIRDRLEGEIRITRPSSTLGSKCLEHSPLRSPRRRICTCKGKSATLADPAAPFPAFIGHEARWRGLLLAFFWMRFRVGGPPSNKPNLRRASKGLTLPQKGQHACLKRDRQYRLQKAQPLPLVTTVILFRFGQGEVKYQINGHQRATLNSKLVLQRGAVLCGGLQPLTKTILRLDL